jgi:glycosyltransferase involved in cell wall biosynthesis
MRKPRLAAVVSHPIQYYAPFFRTLAARVDLHVFFGQKLTPAQQANAGFDTPFDWDVDLLSGYASTFLTNVARRPGPGHFFGCDTPEIGARLREGGFDAVLVLGWYLKTFIQATWAAKRLGLPVLVRGDSQLATPRGPTTRAAKALAYPPLLRAFDAALYVGRRSRAYYEHYHYPANRLFFSPHCVDTAWFAARASAEAGHALRARLGIAPGDRVALFAGKLLPFKRPLDVVEACVEVPSAHVVVAGSGELDAPLRARAASLGVRLHSLGFLNQTQMPAAYAAADVLVLPSTGRESWGLVANEALACGTPIIVSDAVGCAPDLAADGLAGSVFPLGDIASLRQTILAMLNAPPSQEAIAARSNAYGLAAAVDGVEAAVAAVRRRPGARAIHG